MVEEHKNQAVLLVGHNGIDKALIAVIMNKTFKEMGSIENLHNTSINIYEIDENKNHKVILFNSTKHLV